MEGAKMFMIQDREHGKLILTTSPLHTGNSTLIVFGTDPRVCFTFQLYEILEGF